MATVVFTAEQLAQEEKRGWIIAEHAARLFLEGEMTVCEMPGALAIPGVRELVFEHLVQKLTPIFETCVAIATCGEEEEEDEDVLEEAADAVFTCLAGTIYGQAVSEIGHARATYIANMIVRAERECDDSHDTKPAVVTLKL